MRPNSFHFSRIPKHTVISANGSTCYLWRIKFDKTVQISHLLIDISTPTNNSTKETPNLVPIVSKYRDCELQKTKTDPMDEYGINIFGYYYFCDLKSEEDRKKELTDLTDTILVKINSSFEREIGLDAVFIGGLYTTTYSSGKSVKPDCGKLEAENVGVNVQEESSYIKVWCNQSFYDYWQNLDKRFDSMGNRKLVINCKVLCCPQKII